jgi:uncharacterized protein YqhQ
VSKVPFLRGLVLLLQVWALAFGSWVVSALIFVCFVGSDLIRFGEEPFMWVIGFVFVGVIFVAMVWLFIWIFINRSMFRWHSMEHKVANLLEGGRRVTMGNLVRSSRIHSRCGSVLLVWCVLLAVLGKLFGFYSQSLFVLVFFPVAYEFHRSGFLSKPFSHIFQPFLTKQPFESDYEVGLFAARFLKSRSQGNDLWRRKYVGVDCVEVKK